MSFELKSAPSQMRKIAIVTGANSGLGYETAIGMAKKGARVILACRNLLKAELARKEIKKKVPYAILEVMQLDLNSLQSVREFATAFTKKHSHLDFLIENAGIMIPPFSKTEDGFESQFGVNYLGHFVLTNRLLPILNKTQGARIITLSSIAHKSAHIDFDNLNAEKGYSKMAAYGQSKLACLMFTYELQRRLEDAGSSTIAVSAHPGVSKTNLAQHISPILQTLLTPIFALVTHSPEKAALPTLMAAIDPNVKGGDFFGPTGFREMKGSPAKVMSEPHSYDQQVAKKLWEASETLTNEKFTV